MAVILTGDTTCMPSVLIYWEYPSQNPVLLPGPESDVKLLSNIN